MSEYNNEKWLEDATPVTELRTGNGDNYLISQGETTLLITITDVSELMKAEATHHPQTNLPPLSGRRGSVDFVELIERKFQEASYRAIFGRPINPDTFSKVLRGVLEETDASRVLENTEKQSEASPAWHDNQSSARAERSGDASEKQTTGLDSSTLPQADKADPDIPANQSQNHDTQGIQSPEASETSRHIPDRQMQGDTDKPDSLPLHHTSQAQGLERQFHNQDSDKSRT